MEIKKGNKIYVHYEGKFETGEVFDSSEKGENTEPLAFIAGVGQVIKGFDEAVIGMKEGEEKEFSIEPNEAYGMYNESLKKEIPKTVLPKDEEPKVGMMIVMATPEGRQIPAKIIDVKKETITIDLNHPLAGKKLLFKIKVVKVEEVKDVTQEGQEGKVKAEEEIKKE